MQSLYKQYANLSEKNNNSKIYAVQKKKSSPPVLVTSGYRYVQYWKQVSNWSYLSWKWTYTSLWIKVKTDTCQYLCIIRQSCKWLTSRKIFKPINFTHHENQYLCYDNEITGSAVYKINLIHLFVNICSWKRCLNHNFNCLRNTGGRAASPNNTVWHDRQGCRGKLIWRCFLNLVSLMTILYDRTLKYIASQKWY